jgi:hypothetical protein
VELPYPETRMSGFPKSDSLVAPSMTFQVPDRRLVISQRQSARSKGGTVAALTTGY